MTKRKTLKEFICDSKRIHGKTTFGYLKANYVNNRTRVTLFCNKCSEYFRTRPTDHTTKSYGCPNCRISKSEKLAVKMVNIILKLKDISNRLLPANPTDVPWLKGLHLDGYNDDIKLAIEYQGIQHYSYPNYYHRDISEFNKQLYNDRAKVRRCKRNSVKLLVIPHTLSYKNYEEMYKFIYKKLKNFKS